MSEVQLNDVQSVKIMNQKDPAWKAQKAVILVLSCLLYCGLPACITSQKMMDNINGHYYKYTFAVREATTRKKTTNFENKYMQVHFDPAYHRVNFDLKNLSDQPIEIIWSETVIQTSSDSSHIIHTGIPVSQSANAIAPTKVAPGQTIQDFLLPVDLIHKKDGVNTIEDIYPEKDDSLSVKNDWIMQQIGQNLFIVYLAMRVKGQKEILRFRFYPIIMQRGASSFKK